MPPKKIAPYLVFAGDMRDKCRAELVAAGNPKPAMGDVAKRVGEKWKELDEEAKQMYKDRAEATNAEAAREYAEKVEAGEIDEAAEDGDDAAPDTSLPLARVKRIMKLDKEVKHAAVDACKCVTRATELFLESLVEGAFASMKAQKRKTIKYQDVEHHVLRKQRLEFLHDHVWAMQEKATATDGGKENRGTETEGGDDGEGTETEGGARATNADARAPPEAPPGARQVTDFFSPAQEQAAEETPA